MNWDKAVKEVFGKDTRIIFPRYFWSKKNQVTLLIMEKNRMELKVVAKYFVWGEAKTEWEILKKAHQWGLKTPKPLHLYKNIIFMEFLPGLSLKIMSDEGREPLPVDLLAKWLADFHRAFKNGDKTLLKGDGMFPNFLYREDKNELYGVDFEESIMGEEITDVGEMVTSLLLMGDSFSEKNLKRATDFFKTYTDNYPVTFNHNRLLDQVKKELEKRKMFIPHKKEELDKYIQWIEKGKMYFF